MFISKILQNGKNYPNADLLIVIEQNVHLEDFTKWKKSNADVNVLIVIEQNVNFDNVRPWEQK